jgi:RNA polymerase sigma factor (sigma-70 family)
MKRIVYRALERIKRVDVDKELEARLVARYKNGDSIAGGELLKIYHSVMTTLATAYKSSGADFDDMVQEGRVGFLENILSYDETRGASLITHCAWGAFGGVMRAVRASRLLKMSNATHDKIRKSLRAYDTEELCYEELEAVKNGAAFWAYCKPFSLDAPLPNRPGYEAETLNDVLQSYEIPADTAIEESELAALIPEILASTSKRQRDIIIRHADGETLEDIGRSHGVTREAARRDESIGLQKARRAAKRLKIA